MTEHDKADQARKGLIDSVKGKVKEVAGAVTGNDSLTAEGQLEQTQARERKEANSVEAIAAARERWGRTRQEAVRKSLLGLGLDLPVDELVGPLRSLLDGDDAEAVFDLRSTEHRPPSGPCIVRLAALRPASGAVTGAVVVVTAADGADAGTANRR